MGKALEANILTGLTWDGYKVSDETTNAKGKALAANTILEVLFLDSISLQ